MSLARDLLRRAFRGRTISRRLPPAFGSARVHLSPESQLKHLRPGRAGFDAQLLHWAERYVEPGAVVWDIGANCGVFAFAAAGRGASVLAVEPDPFLANALLKSRAHNPTLNVEILTAAVSSSGGVAALQLSGRGRAANALNEFAGQREGFSATSSRVYVPTLRLDDLLKISRPSFVKIDIEGAEVAALQGAAILLREVRPTLVVEVDCGKPSSDEVFAILRAAGYGLRDVEHPQREPIATTFNVLALPG